MADASARDTVAIHAKRRAEKTGSVNGKLASVWCGQQDSLDHQSQSAFRHRKSDCMCMCDKNRTQSLHP